MLLHDMMDAAVADVSADLHSLAAASSRRGLAIRRRRRALATVGASAAAVLLSVAGWIAWPGGGDSVVASDTNSRAIDGPLSGVTAPITGGGVAAAFADAVGDVTDGTMTQFQGDATRDGGAEAMAALALLPTTGSGPAGEVMINLQPLRSGGPQPYTCDNPSYLSDMTRCAVRTLSNGDVLRTYHDDGDTEFGSASQRVVAELLSSTRHLRVVVFARNTNPQSKGDFRDQTVLDLDQLTEIATQPWWSRTELPREYVVAGQQIGITSSS